DLVVDINGNMGIAKSTYQDDDLFIQVQTIYVARVLVNGTYPQMSVGKATNATNATKATQDGNGNNIVNTYAIKRSTVSTADTIYDVDSSVPSAILQPNTAFADSPYQEIRGGNLNEYVYSGHFVIRSDSSYPVTNMPINTQSTAKNGVWHLIVLRYTSLWI